ncbi:MAG: hypothetical protein ACYDEJ_11060 [Desulfitobacteriaceae bacterium]
MRARKNNTVPTGYNLKEHMISEIEKVKPELAKSTIDKQSFSWIAETKLSLNAGLIIRMESMVMMW